MLIFPEANFVINFRGIEFLGFEICFEKLDVCFVSNYIPARKDCNKSVQEMYFLLFIESQIVSEKKKPKSLFILLCRGSENDSDFHRK